MVSMGIGSGFANALKPRFSGWQNLAGNLWNEKAGAAEAEYAVVNRNTQKAKAQVALHAKIPRTDYVRPNGSLESVVERFANQQLTFESPDGKKNTLSGQAILQQLVTDQAVRVNDLYRLENLEDMNPKEYEQLGRSNQYIHEEMLPELGGVAGNKGTLYQFLGDAQRQGVLYILKDTNPNRVGKSYYGVPTEVRALLSPQKTGNVEAPKVLDTPQTQFAKGLKAFFETDTVKNHPDTELRESIANLARAASSPRTSLEGFGYGDIPTEIRQSKAFAESNESLFASNLLSLFEASAMIDPEQLAPRVEALCHDAVTVGLLNQNELDDVLALQH